MSTTLKCHAVRRGAAVSLEMGTDSILGGSHIQPLKHQGAAFHGPSLSEQSGLGGTFTASCTAALYEHQNREC